MSEPSEKPKAEKPLLDYNRAAGKSRNLAKLAELKAKLGMKGKDDAKNS